MGFVADVFSGGGGDDFSRAEQLFANIDLPNYEQMVAEMRALVEAGEITPEEYQIAVQDPSMLLQYSADPRLRSAQLNALTELERIGTEGGLTAGDRARIDDISRRVSTADRGRREAILQNAAERGVGGSGLEIASQLMSGQASADRAARESGDVAARAEERALAALMNAGQLGGELRGQDFAERARIAEAQDAINRFNAAQRTEANRGNVTARNIAREGNRAYRTGVTQGIHDLQRQKFADELAKTSGQAGMAEGLGSLQERRRDRGQQILGGGLGAALFAMSDIAAKENIEPGEPDLDDFMENLTINKYDYKDPESHGEGKHYGPMAQDLEKSEVGQSMVVDTEDGKMVDYGKSLPVMMSVLKELYDKVEGMERATA